MRATKEYVAYPPGAIFEVAGAIGCCGTASASGSPRSLCSSTLTVSPSSASRMGPPTWVMAGAPLWSAKVLMGTFARPGRSIVPARAHSSHDTACVPVRVQTEARYECVTVVELPALSIAVTVKVCVPGVVSSGWPSGTVPVHEAMPAPPVSAQA